MRYLEKSKMVSRLVGAFRRRVILSKIGKSMIECTWPFAGRSVISDVHRSDAINTTLLHFFSILFINKITIQPRLYKENKEKKGWCSIRNKYASEINTHSFYYRKECRNTREKLEMA